MFQIAFSAEEAVIILDIVEQLDGTRAKEKQLEP